VQDPTITCPQCRSEIKLTESLAAPLIAATKQQYEQAIAKQRAESAQKEQALAEREAQLVRERESIDAAVEGKVKVERERVTADAAKREAQLKSREAALLLEKEQLDSRMQEQLRSERTRIAAEEARKAKLAVGEDLDRTTREVAELNEILKQRDAKLAEAQQAQADVLRQKRELEDQKREMELTIERRVSDLLVKTREAAKKEAEEGLSLKLIEKEQTITSMQQKIEELKRKAEQGSQQLQGEAQELQLESLLVAKFPHDAIAPVPKGEHGGDILQRVITPAGATCGLILWESKRTKNWSDGWLAKLRDDQRTAKADVAVIVSAILPNGIQTFDQVDGVWVVHPRAALPVAFALRQTLVEVNCAKQTVEGQQTKMELVYQYLTGPRFRHRIEAIVEKFSDMQEDLDKERKTMTRLWAKREEQIRGVIESTAGMYGDLQGIAGKSLAEIGGLTPQLEDTAAAHNKLA
jgi:hypothetical protein